jgi:cytoskeletal protein CcmA (bactofilin family)
MWFAKDFLRVCPWWFLSWGGGTLLRAAPWIEPIIQIRTALLIGGRQQRLAQSQWISNKECRVEDKQAGLSIIDKTLRLEGTVNVEGKLIILGAMEGTLLGNTVVTAEGSHVVAEARVREMVIGGRFEGHVTAYESLRILQTGRFSGDIVCKNIDLEPGGQLNGTVEILKDEDNGLSGDVDTPSEGVTTSSSKTEPS